MELGHVTITDYRIFFIILLGHWGSCLTILLFIDRLAFQHKAFVAHTLLMMGIFSVELLRCGGNVFVLEEPFILPFGLYYFENTMLGAFYWTLIMFAYNKGRQLYSELVSLQGEINDKRGS